MSQASISHFERGHALEDQGFFEQAIGEFMAGANAGDASCMTRLAMLYTLGKGVACCDYDKAIEWETKAHEADSPMALVQSRNHASNKGRPSQSLILLRESLERRRQQRRPGTSEAVCRESEGI
jgi:TPR repeat protein